MTRETLIKVIDEEFGNGYSISWLLDIFIEAVELNESKVIISTVEYDKELNYFRTHIRALREALKIMENAQSNTRTPIKR